VPCRLYGCVQGRGSLDTAAFRASRPTAIPTAARSPAAWTALCRISAPLGGSSGRRAESGTGSGVGRDGAGGGAAAARGFGATRGFEDAVARGFAADFGLAALAFDAREADALGFAALALAFVARDALAFGLAAAFAAAFGFAAAFAAPPPLALARRELRRAGRLRGSRERTSSESSAGVM
jgi:hypothetical protein